MKLKSFLKNGNKKQKNEINKKLKLVEFWRQKNKIKI